MSGRPRIFGCLFPTVLIISLIVGGCMSMIPGYGFYFKDEQQKCEDHYDGKWVDGQCKRD